MNKDSSLLRNVSKFFTESTLANIVAKVCNEDVQNVQILSWNFGEASRKGDGNMSIVSRVVIKSKVKSRDVETKIVVKSLPRSIGRIKTFRLDDIFRNEIIFYTEIADKFKEFLKSKNQTSLLLIPECLAYHLDGREDYLALLDMSNFGFTTASREEYLTLEECENILEAMARFHGISFAYKDKNSQDFLQRTGKLEEMYYTDDIFDTWYKRLFETVIDIAKDALAKEYPGSEAERRFNSINPRELYNKSVEFCSRTKAPTSVVSQGDSWAPNFMIRDNPSGKKEVLLLDFQMARCASLVLDVSFFIYSCTDKSLRDKHFDNLLDVYYKELAKTIEILGSDAKSLYPRETFLHEVNEQFIHGLVFGLEALPAAMLSPEETFNSEVTGDEKVEIMDIWVLNRLKTPEKRRRLADMILDAVERQYL
ncbi:hypothetical protein QAD02_006381 [Eretmocerus hayati]|uniref:Uncharacterized protein n=1 Tax=Eretmocerus hayati TaxID=131215 RepID=A0ACC2N0R9_9HYME|nr:hypothetical protein QAD02_006381 [Eretmocerus hayati]